MIYVPSRRLIHASLSLGEIPPPGGFSFPTPADYVAGTASSIQYVNSLSSGDRNGMFTPPVVSSGAAFKGMMESATGTTIGKIIENAASGNMDVVSLVSSLTTNLLMGAVDIAVSQVGSSVGSSVGSALGSAIGGLAQAIPVLGQIVSIVVGYLTDFFTGESDAQKALEEKRRQEGYDQQLNTCLNSTCNRLIGQCSGRASMKTDAGIVMSPSDSFRNIAYAMNGYIPLPIACPSSMYVLLCGAEDPGGMIDRARYDAIVNRVRRDTGDPKIGLPQHVQRAMAKLIIGICQSVTNPEAGFTGAPIKDQGRSLYPMLIDIVYKHWKPYVVNNNAQVEGYWDYNLLYAFVDDMLGTCKAYGSSINAPVTKQSRIIDSCNFVGNLYKATGFMKLIGEYEAGLRWDFGLPNGGLSPTPVNSTTTSKLRTIKKTARLVMSTMSAKKILSGGDDSSLSRTLFIGTGMAVSGLFAWQGAKHLAKGRKHR